MISSEKSPSSRICDAMAVSNGRWLTRTAIRRVVGNAVDDLAARKLSTGLLVNYRTRAEIMEEVRFLERVAAAMEDDRPVIEQNGATEMLIAKHVEEFLRARAATVAARG